MGKGANIHSLRVRTWRFADGLPFACAFGERLEVAEERCLVFLRRPNKKEAIAELDLAKKQVIGRRNDEYGQAVFDGEAYIRPEELDSSKLVTTPNGITYHGVPVRR